MEISNGGILHVNNIGFTPYSGGYLPSSRPLRQRCNENIGIV